MTVKEHYEACKKKVSRRSLTQERFDALFAAVDSGKLKVQRRYGELSKPEGSRRFDETLWQYAEYEDITLDEYIDGLAIDEKNVALGYKHIPTCGLLPNNLVYTKGGKKYAIAFQFVPIAD